jgi:hypothetical protein
MSINTNIASDTYKAAYAGEAGSKVHLVRFDTNTDGIVLAPSTRCARQPRWAKKLQVASDGTEITCKKCAAEWARIQEIRGRELGVSRDREE